MSLPQSMGIHEHRHEWMRLDDGRYLWSVREELSMALSASTLQERWTSTLWNIGGEDFVNTRQSSWLAGAPSSSNLFRSSIIPLFWSYIIITLAFHLVRLLQLVEQARLFMVSLCSFPIMIYHVSAAAGRIEAVDLGVFNFPTGSVLSMPWVNIKNPNHEIE